MTAEYLLEAMGLIDDDLIQDAEVRPTPRPARSWRQQWGALAACLAVVIALGYGVAHLPTAVKSSSSTASDAAASAACGSANTESGDWANSPASTEPELSGTTDGASIFTGEGVYALTGEVADALPESAQALEPLSGLYPDASSPSTDAEEYVGCALFEAPDGRLYLQLPQGGYAVAELVEP